MPPAKSNTIAPTRAEADLAAKASRSLSRHAAGALKIRMDDGEELTLPASAAKMLTHMLTELSLGNAVTLVPAYAEFTTRQAADYLNVSRPHVVKLLEQAKMPFHMAGTHRRIKFSDLETFKQSHESSRLRALSELAAQAQELDMGYQRIKKPLTGAATYSRIDENL
jgi:excisionase family DNA binding protein